MITVKWSYEVPKVALSVHFMKMSLEIDAESKIVQMTGLLKAKHAESTSQTKTNMCINIVAKIQQV